MSTRSRRAWTFFPGARVCKPGEILAREDARNLVAEQESCGRSPQEAAPKKGNAGLIEARQLLNGKTSESQPCLNLACFYNVQLCESSRRQRLADELRGGKIPQACLTGGAWRTNRKKGGEP